MKIGIICPSEIAQKRFLPALSKIPEVEFSGVAVCAQEEFATVEVNSDAFAKIRDSEYTKANAIVQEYGGKIFDSYNALVSSNEIDALYIPLPPALHFRWAKTALENHKHVLVEKPSTTSYLEAKQLTEIAMKNGLALHENYMFCFHNQLSAIDDIMKSGEIGELRLYRISFGFPMREKNDFRYNRLLGGGALLDAGGYVLKFADKLLGKTAKICCAQINSLNNFEVDMYGSATLTNDDSVTAQIAFGMDNSYKCELEVWGSKGCLTATRVLTAPCGFAPEAKIRIGNDEEIRKLPADDAFGKSIKHFLRCITDVEIRNNNYEAITRQAELVEQFKIMANCNVQ